MKQQFTNTNMKKDKEQDNLDILVQLLQHGYSQLPQPQVEVYKLDRFGMNTHTQTHTKQICSHNSEMFGGGVKERKRNAETNTRKNKARACSHTNTHSLTAVFDAKTEDQQRQVRGKDVERFKKKN